MSYKQIKSFPVTTTTGSKFKIQPNKILVTLSMNMDGDLYLHAEPKKGHKQVDCPIMNSRKVGNFKSVDEFTPTNDEINEIVNSCLISNKLKLK